MRPQSWSRVAAALVVLMVWVASLVSDPGTVQGASTVVVSVTDRFCESRLEEKVLQYQRQQARLEKARRMQEREDQRSEQAALLEYSQLLHQQQALHNVASSRIVDLVPEQYRTLVLDVAERFGLDPRLLAAVGSVESQWYARALGTHGDSGLMQILPSTAEWIASRMGLKEYDLYDPLTNMMMGAWYLHVLRTEYGNWPQALAVYNGGPLAAPQGAEHRYTKLVMRVYHQQGG